MNNSVFGKTMENLRKRVDIQLIHREQRLLKVTAKPGFKSFKIFNEDLASVELKKQNLVLNRPIYTETKKFSNKWKKLDFITKCGIGCRATMIKVLVMKCIEA
jgi:hypothetical protein